MERKGPCPMRHANGNCLPCGGFCLAVNDEICTALHSAYQRGRTSALPPLRKKKPPTDLAGKCGSCTFAEPAQNVYGGSKNYIICTNQEMRDCRIKRGSSNCRRRIERACRWYKMKEE